MSSRVRHGVVDYLHLSFVEMSDASDPCTCLMFFLNGSYMVYGVCSKYRIDNTFYSSVRCVPLLLVIYPENSTYRTKSSLLQFQIICNAPEQWDLGSLHIN